MTNSICEGDGHILMLPLYQIILYAPDTRHTYQSHLNLDHRAERGSRVIGRPRKRKKIFYIISLVLINRFSLFSLHCSPRWWCASHAVDFDTRSAPPGCDGREAARQQAGAPTLPLPASALEQAVLHDL